MVFIWGYRSNSRNTAQYPSPVREDFGGHPASFPRMRVSYFRNVASHFGTFLSETFGPRRGSSVDLTSDELDL
ncbi:hypothetical protein RRG08_019972 [Elysia crispata]|uniref:Uncharacterized protein n=1 Tax=Elysia crispata TaxID=231223 RepID=A0AAE1D4S1_9GAST|nr:hypothetical protein RRG08_019972 [Elysia crispata]